jgi:RNA polymerase sigma-70 factor (ECF subfamily)
MAEAGLDIKSCLQAVRRQDEEAARALVQHLYPLVMRVVRSYWARQADPEDMAQMVFVKMFQHLEQYAGQVPFEHWVSRIAVNTCLNQLRSERVRPELRWADLSEEAAAVIEGLMSMAADPAAAEQVATRELAGKMLQTLPPADRLVLTMLDMEGHSVEDVRKATGWGASLVKVRAFRARRKLRKQFEKVWKGKA